MVASSGLKDFEAHQHYCVILPEWAKVLELVGEPLKALLGWWSRRIDAANRLVYRVRDDRVGSFHAARTMGITSWQNDGRPAGRPGSRERGRGSLVHDTHR